MQLNSTYVTNIQCRINAQLQGLSPATVNILNAIKLAPGKHIIIYEKNGNVKV